MHTSELIFNVVFIFGVRYTKLSLEYNILHNILLNSYLMGYDRNAQYILSCVLQAPDV